VQIAPLLTSVQPDRNRCSPSTGLVFRFDRNRRSPWAGIRKQVRNYPVTSLRWPVAASRRARRRNSVNHASCV